MDKHKNLKLEKAFADAFVADIINKFVITTATCGYINLDSKWKSKGVCSPFSRLYYVADGEGFVRYNDTIVTMKPGNVYLIPAELKFDYWCNDKLSKFFFHINIAKPDGYDLFSKIREVLSLKIDTILIREMEELWEKKTVLTSLMLKEILYRTAAGFAQQDFSARDINYAFSQSTRNVINFIHDNLSANLTLDEVSKSLGISVQTLRKNFKNEFGVSPGKYIDDVVFKKAENYLLNTDMSVCEISDKLGFCDQFYFSNRFKARYGYSPQKYRSIRRIIV